MSVQYMACEDCQYDSFREEPIEKASCAKCLERYAKTINKDK